MKTSILSLALILASGTAQASYYQIKCSSALGTVQTASGHGSNYFRLGGLSLPVDHIDQEIISKEVVQDVQQTRCEKGQSGGVWNRVLITQEVVLIKKADGTAFAELSEEKLSEIEGLSSDRLSIQVPLTCEMNMNSMARCH